MNDQGGANPERKAGGANSPQPQGRPSLWLWAILMLLIWNVLIFRPAAKTEVNIPYSSFLAQVRAGNVLKVAIVGPQIDGTLAKPILWPPESAASASQSQPAEAAKADSPKANPPSENHASKNAPENENKSAKKPEGASKPYTEFTTLFPESVGDPGLILLLEKQNVTIEAKRPTKPWFTTLLVDWGPMLLLVGYFVWMGRKTMSAQSGVFGIGKTKARRYSSEQSKVTFDDVSGAGEAKEDLQELVDFLRNPEKYHKLGAHIPRGTLLVGPPGTGKTLLAKAVAGEANVPFFHLSGSEFVEMFVGVGASRVRDLFGQAKAASPSIIFVDELDAVGRRRGAGLGATNDEREQTLNQLLVEMDGFDERQEVLVLAATNRPDVLDPALLRPGRFDRQVTVPLPDREGRQGILKIHSEELPLAPDIDLGLLSSKTVGMSGADLANICNEAALFAARHGSEKVNMANFEEAIDKVVLGGERPSLTNPHDREVVAYHESGHAMVAWLTPAADPVHKVTIIPHGRALGVTEQVPGEDQYNYSRTYLIARIDVMLGGRISEQTVFGDITTGAENDLLRATRLARRMVTRWAMGSLGPLAFESDEEQPFLGYELSRGRDYSESTAARIDEDVRRLMEERFETVTRLLSGARDKLDELAKILLRDETVEERALEQILGPRGTHAGAVRTN